MTVAAEMCPNCGAPLSVVNGHCAFCQVPLNVSEPHAVGSHPHSAPPGDPNAPFALQVEDVFSIKGRGTVITGTVSTGTLRVGQHLVIGGSHSPVETKCQGIEAFRKSIDSAKPGDFIGVMLAKITREQVSRGDWVRSA